MNWLPTNKGVNFVNHNCSYSLMKSLFAMVKWKTNAEEIVGLARRVNIMTFIIISELTHSRTNQLEHIREIKLQPLAWDFEKHSWYSSSTEKNVFLYYLISRHNSFGVFPNYFWIASNEPMTYTSRSLSEKGFTIYKNMRFVNLLDMFLNPGFKITTWRIPIELSTITFVYRERFQETGFLCEK